MADPLSITASLLAITTAAIQTTRSLYKTVKRFNDRDKTLRRLRDELESLVKILESLAQVTHNERPLLELLQGPVERCSQVCGEFEVSIQKFGNKAKMNILDWTKLEFMRGDINEFIDTLAGYKSTITVALGTITIHSSKVSDEVLQEYNEVIHDTMYNLELRLQRIDEKVTRLNSNRAAGQDNGTDLKNEREVTEQCLRICADARTYLGSLSNHQSALLPKQSEEQAEGPSFEAQLRTRQVLDANLESFAQTMNHLQRRLTSLVEDGNGEDDRTRERLLADIEISKQCLNVCQVASEVARQKVFRVGEVIADGNSDQVVVTTLADLFDVKRALAKDGSAQLVGSVSGDELHHLVEKRYSSRFGSFTPKLDVSADASNMVGIYRNDSSSPNTTGGAERSCEGRVIVQPSPNETRKRTGDESQTKRR